MENATEGGGGGGGEGGLGDCGNGELVLFICQNRHLGRRNGEIFGEESHNKIIHGNTMTFEIHSSSRLLNSVNSSSNSRQKVRSF